MLKQILTIKISPKIKYFGSALILGCLLFPILLHSELREIQNQNEIKVFVSEHIDPNSIKIVWEGFDEVDGLRKAVVFENGAEKKVRYKTYGNNKFYVFLDQRLIGSFGHFKTNNWHGHKYEVFIRGQENSYRLESKIHGPDENL